MADSKVGFDTPMALLGEISHNINSEFVVRNMNCFTILASDNGWGPPTNMLKKEVYKILIEN